MRALLFFLLALIAIYWVRRALRRPPGGGAGAGRRDSARGERMVECAHCGLHVPESESVQLEGEFYCSAEHRRLHRDAGV